MDPNHAYKNMNPVYFTWKWSASEIIHTYPDSRMLTYICNNITLVDMQKTYKYVSISPNDVKRRTDGSFKVSSPLFSSPFQIMQQWQVVLQLDSYHQHPYHNPNLLHLHHPSHCSHHTLSFPCVLFDFPDFQILQYP